MSVDQVTAQVGQPSRISGSDGVTLVYEHPESGARVELNLAPGLVSAKRVFEGATLELL